MNLINKNIQTNRYDTRIFLLILSLFFGGMGGAFQVPRILAVLFLPSLFRDIKKYQYLRPIRRFFVFFIIYISISLVWTPDFSEGVKHTIYYVVHYFLFMEIVIFAHLSKSPLNTLSWAWTLVVFLCSLIAIWELSTGNHLSMAREADMSLNVAGNMVDRVNASATFGNYNGYVTFLCFSLPWIFYLVTSNRTRGLQRYIALFSIVASITTILIDGSRGGMFSVIIVLIIYCVFMPKNKMNIFILSMAIVSFSILLYKFQDEIFFVLAMKNEGEGLASDDSRMMIWGTSMQLLLNSVGIGVGVGGILEALKSASPNIIPITHNMFVEALLQFGVIVSFFYFRFLYRMFRKCFVLSDKSIRMALMMSFLSMPIYCIINSVYLLGPDWYILLSTIFVFTNYERFTFDNSVLRAS